MNSEKTNWTREALKDRLQKRLAKKNAAPAPVVSERRWTFREAAAVLASFNPATLRPVGGEGEAAEGFKHLMEDSVVAPGQAGTGLWQLRSAVRQETLKRMPGREALISALNANRDQAQGLLQQMMEAYIHGRAPEIARQTVEELTASLQVVRWLGNVLDDLPPPQEIKVWLEKRRFLIPFEHLVGDHFRGRDRELTILRDYVGVFPPGSVQQALGRQLRKWLDLKQKPPLIVYGPGGIGKSTLVSKFILEHATVDDALRFPYAYLDFDSPYLIIEDPLSLLAEAIRQLEIQYPERAALFEDLKQAFSQAAVDAPFEGEAISSQQVIVSKHQSNLAKQGLVTDLFERFGRVMRELVRRDNQVEAPFLLIFDTFEEVQYKVADQAEQLTRIIDILRSHCPTLRTVVSGRAPVEDLGIWEKPPKELPVSDFDDKAAHGFLQMHGITDPEVAGIIFKQVGGNPLSLKLAAEVIQNEGGDVGAIKGLQTSSWLIFAASETVIQGQLYRRILRHIHDDDVRKLAHPGLVLRRVTPPLIAEVLAEPCGLEDITAEQAASLFEKLKQEVALVTLDADGSLRHRQDVRRVMLKLLQKDKRDQVRAINEAAVAYYQRQTDNQDPIDPIARAEEVYHRLQLRQESWVIDERWLDDIIPYLQEALEELPAGSQLYLASRLGITLPQEVLAQVEARDWERYALSRVEGMINSGSPQRALELLGEQPKPWFDSLLYLWEARALTLMQALAEALEVVNQGIVVANETGCYEDLLELFQLGADLAQRLGDAQTADRLLAQAEQTADRLREQVRHLELLLTRLQLQAELETANDDQTRAMRSRLAPLFGTLPDEALIRREGLVRGVAGEVGLERPDLLGRGVRLAGLGRLEEPQLKALAEVLAVTEEARQKGGSDLMGTLARTVGVKQVDDALAAWTGIVFQAYEADRLDEFVHQIMTEDEDNQRLYRKVAQIMKRSSRQASI